MCWQLTLLSFRTPSTQPGKDGYQLPWSLKSSRAFLPTAQSWEHRLCTLRYVADLNLTDYHASLIRAGQELFRKVTLGYFYQKLMISETRQLSKTQCTYRFSLEGFLVPKYFWAERTLSPKSYSSSSHETTATVFQVLIVCIAPDKCYLFPSKSLVSLIQSNFGFYLGFFLGKKDF